MQRHVRSVDGCESGVVAPKEPLMTTTVRSNAASGATRRPPLALFSLTVAAATFLAFAPELKAGVATPAARGQATHATHPGAVEKERNGKDGRDREDNEDRKGSVWVVNRDRDELVVFDAETGAVVATRAVGAGAHDICISERARKA